MLRFYQMVRHEDETGNSGTGPVAIAVEFPDGKCVLKWDGGSNSLGIGSMVLYDCFEDMERVHGHGGKTTFEPLVDEPEAPLELKHLKPGTTLRNFGIFEGIDTYGKIYQLQESSVATDERVWVGVGANSQRAHLNREMAGELGALLTQFSEHGWGIFDELLGAIEAREGEFKFERPAF